MKRWIVVAATALALATATMAQERATFTGTVLIYGSGMNTRTTTNTFTMTLNRQTSGEDAHDCSPHCKAVGRMTCGVNLMGVRLDVSLSAAA